MNQLMQFMQLSTFISVTSLPVLIYGHTGKMFTNNISLLIELETFLAPYYIKMLIFSNVEWKSEYSNIRSYNILSYFSCRHKCNQQCILVIE